MVTARDTPPINAWAAIAACASGVPRSSRLFALVDPGDTARLVVEGSILDRIGNAVALVPRRGPALRDEVVIGVGTGSVGGVLQTGGARIFACDDAGCALFPSVAIGGETGRTGTLVGEFVHGGSVAGHSVVVVGGTLGAGSGREEGSLYTAVLTP
jgi:hypothetical protein